jgi:hypothetical protein
MGKRKKLRWKEGKEEDIILNIKFWIIMVWMIIIFSYLVMCFNRQAVIFRPFQLTEKFKLVVIYMDWFLVIVISVVQNVRTYTHTYIHT